MEQQNERTSLNQIHSRKRSRISCGRPRYCTKSNAAVLILTWSVVFSTLQIGMDPTAIIIVYLNFLDSFSRVIIMSSVYGVLALVWLFYPLAGLLADICFGRYKVVLCSLRTFCITVFVGGCICGPAYLLLISNNNAARTSWNVLLIIFGGFSYLVLLFSYILFSGNVIQFGMDQLQDSPSKDSILYIYWYVWIYFIGVSMARMFWSALPCNIVLSLVILSFAAVGLIALPVSVCFMHSRRVRRWFVVEPGLQNPYKLVIKVLKFAATHHQPIQRSAFTYCEDELPSRLDLGKSKYGGPFTTEEVENVKVFIGILCVLITLGPFFTIELTNYVSVLVFNFHLGDWINGLGGDGCDDYGLNLLLGNGLLTPIIAVVLIPLYIIFIPQSCISKYTPSMLKRMGLAMLMYLIALLCTFFTDVIGHNDSKYNRNATCMFTTDYETDSYTPDQPQTLHMNSAALLAQNIFSGLGVTLFYTAVYEFICAQSPHQMKGMIIGIFFAIKGVCQLIGVAVILIPFHYWSISELFPSCGFAYYLINIFIAAVGLLTYTWVARRYHYRQRDEPSNVHQFVERYYEQTESEPVYDYDDLDEHDVHTING